MNISETNQFIFFLASTKEHPELTPHVLRLMIELAQAGREVNAPVI